MEIYLLREITYGGIFGREYSDTTEIDRCFNKGKIEGKYLVGGLAGHIDCWHDDIITIKNSYNLGQVIATLTVAGIVCDDERDANLFIKNVYNAGKVTQKDDNGKSYAISGMGELNNVFFWDSCGAKNMSKGIAKKKDDMKKENIIGLLNNDLETRIWIKDIKNINEGFPVLNWQ